MRIAAQIGDDLPWAGKRWLGIDGPVVGPQALEPRGKGTRLGERDGGAPELEALLGKGLLKSGEVLGSEDLGEGPDREQEVATFGRDPLLLRRVQRPASDDAVDMEGLLQGLTPGVQHHGDPELAPEPFGIAP